MTEGREFLLETWRRFLDLPPLFVVLKSTGGMKEAGAVFFNGKGKTMIREFVGFEAYEAACEGDIGLLGWSPVDTALWLKISMRDVLRAVQDGVLDLCRVIRCDGSVQLLVSLASIRAFRWPYEVEGWKPHRKRRHIRRPRRWQLLMLEADQQRGAWQYGMSSPA